MLSFRFVTYHICCNMNRVPVLTCTGTHEYMLTCIHACKHVFVSACVEQHLFYVGRPTSWQRFTSNAISSL